MIQTIPCAAIFGNPNQPRQTFEEGALRELAASIEAQGLIQPITVTPVDDGRFMIVAGERRFRAHVLLGRETIDCIVRELNARDVMLQSIIENALRKDVNLIEEAIAYQRCLDLGVTVEELAGQLGVAPFRIRWRVSLLGLRPEYQGLAKAGQITAAQALELAKLEPADQDRLFAMIRSGQCATTLALTSAAAAIRDEANQTDCFGEADKPSESSRRLAAGFEARVRRLCAMLNEATVENEVVAVRKVDPTRAGTLADLFAAMRGDLERIETALRACELKVAA